MDIFQPCVSFNKINTKQWFKENTYYLEDHEQTDRQKAFEKATETEKLPLGVFYTSPEKSSFEENIRLYKDNQAPLYEREPDMAKLQNLIDTFKISL